MNNKEELIWNYLDGQVSEDERLQIEQTLKDDEAFRELFLQSRLVHQNLQKMEAEGPSLRFAQNIMDRLPAVRNLATGPLISTKWIRTFYGRVFATLLILVAGIAWLSPPSTGMADAQAEDIIGNVRSVFDLLPANALLLPGIIVISLLLLLFLDRWLQQRFQRS